MYTYKYLVCVCVCLCVCVQVAMASAVALLSSPPAMGVKGQVCLCIRLCTRVCVGGGGGVDAYVYGRSVCVWGGGGSRTCVHVRAQYRMCVLCSLNTGSPPDSINFMIIVISCALKLKFAIHVLMLD